MIKVAIPTKAHHATHATITVSLPRPTKGRGRTQTKRQNKGARAETARGGEAENHLDWQGRPALPMESQPHTPADDSSGPQGFGGGNKKEKYQQN